MKTLLALSPQRRLWVFGWIAACTMAASSLGAQTVVPRISSEITSSEQATLKGSLHPMAQAQFEAGRVPSDTKLSGITIVFSRSAAQQADLDALIAAQQNPASPLYHQWLTPDQFAARFGMAQADLDKVSSWIEQQGFSVDSVARSRNSIHFSGTARQVEQAFSTEMHYYTVGGVRHFAPSTNLSVPSALSSVVLAVRNLNDFRPKPMHVAPMAHPNFTSSQSGAVHFAPGDVWTVYDVNPAFNSGYTGTGQSIAIMGQSAIVNSDIENFESAAGLATKDPTLVLVPGTGTSTVFTGDESESDIDLEWSGAIAKGANLIFVYTGSNTNYGVFDSLAYAVDEDLAPIISVSYGSCETEYTSTEMTAAELVPAQAVAQGQTIVVSSGDTGSSGCYGFTNLTTAQQEKEAVSYPASSAYVTAAGGTEIPAADSVSTNSTYWDAQSSTDILTSAKIYIPEIAWNDDALGNGLSSSGGGPSVFISRPSWQAGVTGIPSGTTRLVPDIALNSSPNYPGYLYCTSDTETGITGSCSSGFRDANSVYLTVAGGTSFAAPVFAGMVAIINQAKGYTQGQGLINSTLYSLAANSADYASAFHDITSGNNDCTASSTYCSSTAGFSAGTGYDEVTGLGSVDLANLIAVWPANSATSASLITTTTTISASNTAPALNASDTFTITVTALSGTTSPLGSVKLTIDGGGTTYSNSGSTTTVALTAGTTAGTSTATYQTSFSTSGTHQIIAEYEGSSTFAVSTGIAQVSIASVSSGTGSFTLAASPSALAITRGSEGASTVTVTPAGGYTGTVLMSYDTSNDTALTNLCVYATTTSSGYASVVVSGTSAVTTQLTFDTNASDCAAAVSPAGGKSFQILQRTSTAKNKSTNPAPLGVAFAGLLLAGFLGRHSRKFRSFAGMIALFAVVLAVSSCGSSNSSSTSTTVANPPKGTYTITLSAQDSTTATIKGSTTFTLTIQ